MFRHHQRPAGAEPRHGFLGLDRRYSGGERIDSMADLQQRCMETLPTGLRSRAGDKLDTLQKAGSRLAIVAADVTSTETKVVFPRRCRSVFRRSGSGRSGAVCTRVDVDSVFLPPLRIDNLPQGAVGSGGGALGGCRLRH